MALTSRRRGPTISEMTSKRSLNSRSTRGRGIVGAAVIRSPSQSAHWATIVSRISAITRPAASNAGCEARTTVLPGEGESIYSGAVMGSKSLVRPPTLRRGSRVALVAPAGPLLERDDLTRAVELCRALDYEPTLAPKAGARHGYFAGTDEERLADLNRALADPEVDAIWCIRGGYG